MRKMMAVCVTAMFLMTACANTQQSKTAKGAAGGAAIGAALGAAVIEKHLTLDRGMDGPDHPASIEPDELAALVRAIREAEQSLGSGAKLPTPGERRAAATARSEGRTYSASPAFIGSSPDLGLPAF